MMTTTLLFFSISGGEIFIIFLFVLIFFGADKIPDIARTMGRTIRQVKDATSEIQKDIQSSVKDVKDELKETRNQVENDGASNKKPDQ